jgi:hypothetical protein
MEYDINEIRALCDRYFDGETSAQEELTLKEYFCLADEVPEDLRAVKVMICGFADAASMTYRPAPAKPKGTFRRLVWGTVAAAASVALCVAYFNREIYGYDADGKAITDPEIALEGTQYLSYLSQLETAIDIAQMITQGMENNN